MFYKTVRHLLPFATAADLCAADKIFLSVFANCQLTLKPDFLRFADELCLIGSSSFTESVYKFDKSSTRLPSFDEVMNTGAAAADESINQSINQSTNQPINQRNIFSLPK